MFQGRPPAILLLYNAFTYILWYITAVFTVLLTSNSLLILLLGSVPCEAHGLERTPLMSSDWNIPHKYKIYNGTVFPD